MIDSLQAERTQTAASGRGSGAPWPGERRSASETGASLWKSRFVLVGIVPAALILAVLYVAYPNPVPDFRPDQEHDAFIYIDLAKSLARGDGYPTKHWMPGFPLLLAAAVQTLGLDFLRLKLMMVGWSASGAVVCFLLLRRLVGLRAGLALALLFAATPIYFDYSHRLMSEVPFVVLSLLALLALVELTRVAEPTRYRLGGWASILIAAGAAAFLVRGNGLALAPALGLAIAQPGLSKPQRMGLGLALAVLIGAFAAWNVRCAGVTFQGIHNVTYLQEVQAADVAALWAGDGRGSAGGTVDLPGLVQRVRGNVCWHLSYRLAALIAPTAEGLTAISVPFLGFAVAALLAGPVLIGAGQLAWRWPALGAYLLASLGLLVVYPTGGAARMLIGSLPLLVLAGYLGIERLFGSSAAAGWALTAVWVSLIQCAIAAQGQSDQPYSYREFGDFVTLLTRDVPAVRERGEAICSPHSLAVKALTDMERVIGRQQAVRGVLDGELPGVLWIRREADDAAADLPDGLAAEELVRRGEFVLSRIRRSDGATERRSDGATERRSDGATERGSDWEGGGEWRRGVSG